MLERIERRNREVWQGHSAGFRDAAELLGGLGLGFLTFGLFRPAVRPFGLILTGAALALYAYAASPRRRPRASEPDEFTLRTGDVVMY
jgi:hypothetical protein